jgi:hypothetical protein
MKCIGQFVHLQEIHTVYEIHGKKLSTSNIIKRNEISFLHKIVVINKVMLQKFRWLQGRWQRDERWCTCTAFGLCSNSLFVYLILVGPCIVDYSVEIPTRYSFGIEFINPKFFEGSTCFERNTAHHQEL